LNGIIAHLRNKALLAALAAALAPGLQAAGPAAASDPQLEGLIQRLRGDDAYERQRAAIALGNLRDPRALEHLVAALGDEDVFVRNFAARSLGQLADEGAVGPLIRALGDENLLVRRSAIGSLGILGSAEAVEPLIGVVRGDGDGIERRAAIEALGRIGDPKGIDPMIEALREGSIYIRNGALTALAGIGPAARPKLVTALSDWIAGPWVVEVLEDLQWQPSSEEERIWFDVASRNGRSILENWDAAKRVLAASAGSGDGREVYNAVVAFIGVGRDETIDELIAIIREKGTVTMAEAFIGSGKDALVDAAREWARRHGAEVDAAAGSPVVEWGALEPS